MSSASSQSYVTATTLKATGITMIVVASVFFVARCVARWYKVLRPQIEDYLMAFAYAFYLTYCIGYLVVVDPMYRLDSIILGESLPYPGFMNDADKIVKVYFVNGMMLFITLWSVKFSLLFLFRRLMDGLPVFLRWWWALFVFCCVVGPPSSCRGRRYNLRARLSAAPSSPISPLAVICTNGSLLVSHAAVATNPRMVAWAETASICRSLYHPP